MGEIRQYNYHNHTKTKNKTGQKIGLSQLVKNSKQVAYEEKKALRLHLNPFNERILAQFKNMRLAEINQKKRLEQKALQLQEAQAKMNIGKGAYGSVDKKIHKFTGEPIVAKTSKEYPTELSKEYETMKTVTELRHKVLYQEDVAIADLESKALELVDYLAKLKKFSSPEKLKEQIETVGKILAPNTNMAAIELLNTQNSFSNLDLKALGLTGTKITELKRNLAEIKEILTMALEDYHGVSSITPLIPGSTPSELQMVQYETSIEDITESNMLRLLSGLQFLHHNDIAHLDIKPKNIVRDKYVRPHLIDYGSARNLKKFDQEKDPALRSPIGTPTYMSPEIICGISKTKLDKESVDLLKRCDIYSLGMTFYELVTGSVFNPIDNPLATMFFGGRLIEDIIENEEIIEKNEVEESFIDQAQNKQMLIKSRGSSADSLLEKRRRIEAELKALVNLDDTLLSVDLNANEMIIQENKSAQEKSEQQESEEDLFLDKMNKSPDASSRRSLLKDHIKENLDQCISLSEPYKKVIIAMLEPDPHQRPNIDEILNYLETALIKLSFA